MNDAKSEDPDLRIELNAILSAMNENLGVEIIWSAMNYLKKNPDKSILEAINDGYGEWIK